MSNKIMKLKRRGPKKFAGQKLRLRNEAIRNHGSLRSGFDNKDSITPKMVPSVFTIRRRRANKVNAQ